MNDLDTRLCESAPRPDLTAARVEMAELASEVSSRRGRLLASSRARAAAIGTAITLVAAPAVAIAAGVHFSAETGRHSADPGTEGDSSEIINFCAPDYYDYIMSQLPHDQPLPPGTTWSGLAHRMVEQESASCPPRGPGIMGSQIGVRSQLLTMTECPWESYLLDARGDGADAERTQAGDAIAQAVTGQIELGTESSTDLRDRARAVDVTYLRHDYEVNCLPLPHQGTGK